METEEEQVERLKAWLKENGLSIVLGIVIGIGGIGGYRYWVHTQEIAAAQASNHFVQMITALSTGNSDTVQQQADILTRDFAASDYALMAYLALAKNHVAIGAFDKAAEALQQVVDSAGQKPFAFLARTRLAAVQIQMEQYDRALTTVAVEFPEEFAATVAELRGDAFAFQGKSAEAVDAYRKAQLAVPKSANIEFLQQKLDDLGGRS